MKVLAIKEDEDGSANLSLDLDADEIQYLIELAVNELLKRKLEDAKDSKESKEE